MCMCVYMYVHVSIFVCVCMFTYIRRYVDVREVVHGHVYVDAHVYVCLSRVHACLCVSMCTNLCLFKCHVYVYELVHACQ